MRIVDGKTSSRILHLSPSAADVLAALPRDTGDPWIVPGTKPATRMTEIDGAWQSIRARDDLPDVRSHDFRPSFPSRALALGERLSMIGKLLGHNKIDTTARYAPIARDSITASPTASGRTFSTGRRGRPSPPEACRHSSATRRRPLSVPSCPLKPSGNQRCLAFAISPERPQARPSLIVDAANEAAKRCYKRIGFTSLMNDPIHIFLPLWHGTPQDSKEQAKHGRSANRVRSFDDGLARDCLQAPQISEQREHWRSLS